MTISHGNVVEYGVGTRPKTSSERWRRFSLCSAALRPLFKASVFGRPAVKFCMRLDPQALNCSAQSRSIDLQTSERFFFGPGGKTQRFPSHGGNDVEQLSAIYLFLNLLQLQLRPCPLSSGAVALGINPGQVSSWRAPAGILPVQREERISAAGMSNQYVFGLKIAMNHSSRKDFATLFNEAPVFFENFKASQRLFNC